jgi:putative ABC transport system permease protein
VRLLRLFYTLPLRMRSLFRRNRVEQDLDDEFRDHLERRIQADIERGMTAEEARYAPCVRWVASSSGRRNVAR